MIRKRIIFFFIALILSGVTFGHAWWWNENEQNQPMRNRLDYQANYQEASFNPATFEVPQFQSKLDIFMSDFVKGAALGDMIDKPNLTNILGQVVAGLSPAGLLTDIRDFSTDLVKSAATGFKEHKQETVMAGFGFLPFLGEVKASMKAWKVGSEEAAFVKAEQALLNSGGVKPPPSAWRSPFIETNVMKPLPTEVSKMFDGAAKPQNFKPGTVLYQAIFDEQGNAVKNSRIFTLEPPQAPIPYRKYETDVASTMWFGHTKSGPTIYNHHAMPPHTFLKTIRTDFGVW